MDKNSQLQTTKVKPHSSQNQETISDELDSLQK